MMILKGEYTMKSSLVITFLIFTFIEMAYAKTPPVKKWRLEEVPSQGNKIIEWKKEPDPQTGHEVWQITDHDSASVAVYFERQAFTSDDRFLVFYSYRTGARQLYRADLTTGEIHQLTKLDRIGTANMHPDGRHCLFQAGVSLLRVDVQTAKIDTVIDGRGLFPSNPWWSASYSSDGSITVVSCRGQESTKMFHVNISTGKIEPIFTWQGRYSHPQVCPGDPNLITFVPGPDTQNDMTLPMEQRARTWIVDARTGEARQFLTCPYGFRATHESWSANGERFFFYKKTVPGWLPVTICSINREGDDWKEYYTHETIRLGHGLSSPDGRWFITDGQDHDHNPLTLIELATGKARILCWPNSSIHRKHAHVHPSFSSSGRFVCYTSDRTGTPQVYVVSIEKEISQ